jgi:uncharacterized protein (TIGR02466 family)
MLEEIIPFATKIYVYRVTQPYNHLVENIKQLRDNTIDVQNIGASNRGGWQSKYFDYGTQEWIKDILHEIAPQVTTIYKDYGIKRDVKLGNYWFNINKKYDYNIAHSHPWTNIVGVLYIKVPKDSGVLKLVRPDECQEWLVPDELSEINAGYFGIVPEEGMLVLFPAYLKHYVEQNRTEDEDDERISISFNFN